jgi:hypothetical protein
MSNDLTVSEKINWLATEYQELRKEIDRRSKEQFVCIVGSIASLGSVLAFVAKDASKYSPLLIIVPWILCVFGFIWTDHAHQIFRLGSYIRNKIESQVNNLAKYQEVIGWQCYVHNIRDELKKKNRQSSLITYFLPLLYFIFPSVICLIAYVALRFAHLTRLPVPVEVAVLTIGIVLLVAIIVNWRRAINVVE